MPRGKKYYKDIVTPWYEVFNEINSQLINFYIKHKNHSGEQLYQICISEKLFVQKNQWIRKFENVFKIKSLDPIHIFSSINGSGQSDENRIEKINAFFKSIGSSKKYSHIDFSGCPSPFFVKMVGARNHKAQKEIWEVYYRIKLKMQEGLNQRVFNRLKNWFGVEVSSFTIFLFWISSDNFLPLDKNTTELLKTAQVLKKRPTTFNEYKRLLPRKNSPLYREITKAAYDFKEDPGKARDLMHKLSAFFNVAPEHTFSLADFRVLAIRPLSGILDEFRKVLIDDTVYPFYRCYDFENLNEIKYHPDKDVRIYDIKEKDYGLGINISAIVGRNGSGKSSLSELFYLVLNNFSKFLLQENCELETKPGIQAELYYYIDTVYKLEVRSYSINMWRYERHNNVYKNPSQVVLNEDDLSSFFYSIAVNYSHFALNSLEIGNWITQMFHKNDGYQIPVVINPMRTEGNIDVNVENSLVISRLLANILEPVSTDSNVANLRQITENGRSAKDLTFSINRKKVNSPDNKKIHKNEMFQDIVLNTVYRYFKIPNNYDLLIKPLVNKYIFRKLVAIVETYPDYKRFSDNKTGLKQKELKVLLSKIKSDQSHKTSKIKQAINFLKYDHLKNHDLSNPLSVEELSDRIQKVIEENPKENLKTILLIPPSFLKVTISLSDNSSFELLSSGEKQRIHIISSIAYHLLNLDSVSTEVVKYSYVNLLFDEIELYFHPEMQRTFLNYLIQYLRKLRLNDIYGLNITFITHSPFILSDIPSDNILFLKADSVPVKDNEKLKTFGANIHDLLSDSFFLDKGFIGKYAEEKINEVIHWTLDKDGSLENKEKMQSVINIIDDPIVKIKVLEMFANKLGENMEVARLKAQQEVIFNRLKELEKYDQNSKYSGTEP